MEVLPVVQKLTVGLPDAQKIDINELNIRLEDHPSTYRAAGGLSINFR